MEAPELKLELERKVTETLEANVIKFEKGEISRSQCSIVAKAIWDISCGLVDSELTDLASRVANFECSERLEKKTFVKVGNVGLVQFIWKPSFVEMTIRMLNIETGEENSSVKKYDSCIERNQDIARHCELLLKTSWIEI